MKNCFVYFISFLLVSFCNAQDNCNCEEALKKLIRKVETEYPGFNEKTKDKPVYDNYKKNLLIKSRDIREPDCIGLLRNYKDFFSDGHMSIFRVEEEQNVRQSQNPDDRISISPEDFQKLLLTTADPLEGVWRSGIYKVGIIKSVNEYQGFIIEADTAFWKPGEIKFRLFGNGKANYYLRDHSLSEETWELVDGWILYFNYSQFIKEEPKPDLSESEIKSKLNEIEGCYFKKVSEKTFLLGTPTYGALDYGSASFFNFGCKNYKLMMPTWRSMRLPDYPIDNIGIQPDIYLDKSVKDWIRFAADYLENK